MIRTLFAVAICAAGLCATTGCKTGPDGKKTVDVAKLADAKAAIEPVASSAIRRALKNSPEHATIVAPYIASVAGVFCLMSANNEFRPEFLVDQADKLLTPELGDIGNGLAIDIKNGVVALYKILWRDQGRAEIPPDQWLHQVVEFFCDSINQGLIDAGYPSGVQKSSAEMRQHLGRLMAAVESPALRL